MKRHLTMPRGPLGIVGAESFCIAVMREKRYENRAKRSGVHHPWRLNETH